MTTDPTSLAVPQPRPPAEAGPPTVVQQIQAAGEALHGALEAQIHSQRMAGASWDAIAQLLGVTKQSAWRRWRYLDELDLVLRVSGRVAHGTREAVLHSPVTGAVVGHEQSRQVLEHGVITDHHDALCGTTTTALPAASTQP